jgi:phytoene/squalene synthetase
VPKQFRLSWWNDSLQHAVRLASAVRTDEDLQMYKPQVPKHPVLEAVFSVVVNAPILSLHASEFATLVQAHALSLHPVSINDLEEYGANSIGSVYRLTSLMSRTPYPLEKQKDIRHSISHMSKALSLFQLLRATPSLLPQKRCYLPSELLSKSKLSMEDLFRGTHAPQALADIVYEIASVAHLHLEHVGCFS